MIYKKTPSKIILAIDEENENKIEKILQDTHRYISCYKFGMQAFYALGKARICNIIEKWNISIFLDLKLCDIPNTVYSAMRSLRNIPNISFFTLHIFGGEEMLLRAIDARNEYLTNTYLMGVTILTSMDKANLVSVNIFEDITTQAVHMSRLAEKTGLDGAICSPHEIANIKYHCPKLEIITPGIRQFIANTDQKRTMTPQEAIDAGANYIVIGREITHSEHPQLVCETIYQELHKK